MNKLSFLIAIIIASLQGAAAQNEFAHRWVENIEPKDYGGDSQVWCVEEGAGGNILFATGEYLTVWDGVRWSRFSPGKSRFIRSLEYDSVSGRVYCSGNGFIGYWVENDFGDFHFTPIEYDCAGSVYWRIVTDKSQVYFQSHENILLYDSESGQVHPIVNEPIDYIHRSGNRIYAQIRRKLYTIEPAGRRDYTGIEIDDRIVTLFPFGGKLCIVTENSGILLWAAGKLTELNEATNRFLARMQIFSAMVVNDNSVLVGSVMDGAYYIDKNGEITEKINEESGLQSTTVLSLGTDDYGNTWLGLDGGIALINGESNESYYNSFSKNIGSVYTTLLIGDKLYMGTNKGLYVSENKGISRFIPNSQGQVWDLFVCGRDVVVNHNKGLFRLSNNEEFELIHPLAWHIRQWWGQKDLFSFCDNEGFLFLGADATGRAVIKNRIEGYGANFESAYSDKYGYLWSRMVSGEILRLTLDRDRRRITAKKRFKVCAEGWVGITILDGDMVFDCQGKSFVFDPATDSIVENSYYTALRKSFNDAEGAMIQCDENFFIAGKNGVMVAHRQGGKIIRVRQIFRNITDRMIPPNFRRFQQLNDSIIAFGFDNGVAFYNINDQSHNREYKLTLSRAEYSLRGELIKINLSDDNSKIRLPWQAANLRLYFTGVPHSYQLEYLLNPDESAKHIFAGEAIGIDFLGSGIHTLTVGGASPDVTPFVLEIEVDKRFIESFWFLLLMMLFLAALSWIGYGLYRRRIKVVKERILNNQQERLQIEKIRHKNQILEIEVRERDKKLTSLAMNRIQINNMLTELHSEVAQIDTANADDAKRKIGRLLRRIITMRQSEDSWHIFEKHFNNVYDGFFDKLKLRYPKLTNNDLKICAYIKLGMTTKEVANLMNIEVSSVESARYRLRKNMDLKAEESLSKLISQI